MDITVNRPEILKVLQICASVVEKRAVGAVIPILKNVRIAAHEEGLTILATNLDVTLKMECAATVRDKGTFLIDLQTFTEFLRNLPDDSVTLATGEQSSLRIEAGTTKFRLPILDADDFPTSPQIEANSKTFTIDMATLVAGYSAVVYAAGDGIVNPAEKIPYGALIATRGDRLDFCATDGRRIALASFAGSLPDAAANVIGDVTPIKAVRAIMKLPTNGEARIRLSENQAFVEFGDMCFLAYKRGGAGFPHYMNVVPESEDGGLLLDRRRFADAIRRAVMLAPNDRGVEIAAKDGRLTTSSWKRERGEGSDVMPYEGEGELSVFVSGEYVSQALDATDTENVSLSFDPKGLVVIRAVADDLDGPQLVHCLAPRSN